MRLVTRPAREHLASYAAALAPRLVARQRPRPVTAERSSTRIAADPAAFLAGLDHRDPAGATHHAPRRHPVPRLPGFVRWIWDGALAGSIGLRWQPGTDDLPPHVLGHVGYAVVPWKRRRGYATRALALLLPEARAQGLRRLELTTEPENLASRRVIERNGGILIERDREAPRLRRRRVPALRNRASEAAQAATGR